MSEQKTANTPEIETVKHFYETLVTTHGMTYATAVHNLVRCNGALGTLKCVLAGEKLTEPMFDSMMQAYVELFNELIGACNLHDQLPAIQEDAKRLIQQLHKQGEQS